MRAIGYLRVSTDEQARGGLGLEAQRQAITLEAERRGWDLEWVEDAGLSARDLRRPGIVGALDTLGRREADVLVVAKLDRLSRSVLDFASVLERSRREGWALVCLDLGLDSSSPNGEALAGMVAVFAQLERRLIAERTKAALAAKAARGETLGRPPQLAAAVRQRVARLRSEGLTLAAIAARLNGDGVPTAATGALGWSPTQVRRALAAR